jgi:hypothetical protein
VQRASGIPCALYFLKRAKSFQQSSGAARREIAKAYLEEAYLKRDVIARSGATKQSILPFARRNGLLRFARNDGLGYRPFRGSAQQRTGNPEIPGSMLAHRPGMTMGPPKINPLLTIHRAKFAQ